MTLRRKLAAYAILPIALLLTGCPGKMEPGFSKSIDVSHRLARYGNNGQQQPESRAQLAVVGLRDPVTVRWTPVHFGVHRGISRITVDFPEHRQGDVLDAVVGGYGNRGSGATVLEQVTVEVKWSRGTVAQARQSSAIIFLKGDGTFVLP